MGRCDGRIAFITGASRGIGKAIARRLASEGAAVVINSPVMGEEEGLPGTLESAVEDIQATRLESLDARTKAAVH